MSVSVTDYKGLTFSRALGDKNTRLLHIEIK